ncbi:MAG: CHASE3 domain-containing protein [Bacteroidota bacterium]|nr:CHASE3 domain-containing protein [Bacteroidota bacterium]
MLTNFIKLGDKVRWGYLTAFILLLISYILTFYSSQQVLNQQNWVNHTDEVKNTLDDVLSEMKDGESSFRGYLVIKDERFLDDYYKAPRLLDSTINKLRLIIDDNTSQQKTFDTLLVLIHNKLAILSTGLVIFKKNNYDINDTMKNMGLRGKQLMDSIKLFVIKMQTEENSLMNERSSRVTTLSNFIKVINVASIVIAIVLAFYSISVFNKENKARHAADKQSLQFREQLEARVKELDKLNIELLELKSIEKFAVTGRISRTIAHEVRNPLTNINLATEHLRSEIKPSADTDILFDMIARNSSRINELISDLLNSTKAAQLNFKHVFINDMLNSALEFAQDRIDLKKIKVIKNYTDDLRPVLADIEKINIAFLNIFVNAIEAMDTGGTLQINTEDKNNRCLITITDNGKGMDRESLSKLFEPYFTTKERGTGLGLTNVQNIILSHHANIYAESEEGMGTSFIISFNYA